MDILNSLQSIGFDWQLALAHLVNFLIVVWLLNYFVFGPMRERLSERKKTIKQGIEDARKAEKERASIKEERKAMLKEVQQQKQAILSEARDTAEKIEKKAKEQARDEAEEIIQRGREKIERERAEMQEELKEKIGGLAIQTAEKIIEREITNDDHDALVSKVINAKSNG